MSNTDLVEKAVSSNELDVMRKNLETMTEEINNLAESLELLSAETHPLAERAAAIVVTDKQSYEAAGATIVEYRGIEKKIKEAIGPAKTAAHKFHRSFTGLENGMLGFVTPHKDAIQEKANVYVAEQRRLQEEEDRRIAEEQRRLQDKLNAAAEKKIEKLMEAGTTLQDKREALARALEDPTASEEERFAAQAHLDIVNAKIENNTEKVAAAVERTQTPVVIPHAPATSSAPLKGAKTKMAAQVVDMRAFLAEVADPNRNLPLNLVSVNMVELNKLVNNGVLPAGIKSVPVTKASFR